MDRLRINISSQTIIDITKRELRPMGSIVLDMSSYKMDTILDVSCSLPRTMYKHHGLKYEYNTKEKTLIILQHNWELCDLVIDFYSVSCQRDIRIKKLLSDSDI